jgi:GTP cyclohydrolase I
MFPLNWEKLDPHMTPLSDVLRHHQHSEENAVRTLLHAIGEDPRRDGLQDTPKRVVKALHELTAGYHEAPGEILSRTFEQASAYGQDDGDEDHDDEYPVYDGLVVLRDIEFCSLCEHHMLPFVGKAHVGYLPGPDRRIVGISKLARLVDCYARRLQVQERLTAQIADAIETYLGAAGVVCVVSASHFCMRMRGCKKQHSSMTTMETRGVLRASPTQRAEALRHVYGS